MAIEGSLLARLLRALCLAFVVSTTTACQAAPTGAATAPRERGSDMAEDAVAPRGAGPRWAATNKLARLEGDFSLDGDGRTLRIAYKVVNVGEYPLLVFDRGDALSVATKRQVSGSVGVPTTQFRDGDLTLSHVARPLSRPAPTAPPSPLVTQVLPGSEYGNHFTHVLPRSGPDAVRRVRYCQAAIGVPEPLPEAERREGGVWSVPNAFAAHQGILCSPWFDLATGGLADAD